MFIRRTDAEAEAPVFWPPDMKSWLIGWCWWRPWCWERLKAKEGDSRGGDGSIADSMDKNLSKLQEIMEDRGACCATVHGATKSWMWLNPGLPHCRQVLYQLSHKESPRILEWITHPFFSGSSWPRNLTGLLHYRQILYQPSYQGSPILPINHILILINYIGILWWLRWNLPEEACNPLQYSYLENPHGQRSVAGYRPRCHKESDTTEHRTLYIYVLKPHQQWRN